AAVDSPAQTNSQLQLTACAVDSAGDPAETGQASDIVRTAENRRVEYLESLDAELEIGFLAEFSDGNSLDQGHIPSGLKRTKKCASGGRALQVTYSSRVIGVNRVGLVARPLEWRQRAERITANERRCG